MGVSIFNTGYDLQDQIDAAESAIAIVSIGDTHVAITSGQYVYVREHGTLVEGLYRATANIAANGTLSGSNVTAVSGGGLNALNSKLKRTRITTSTDLNSLVITMNAPYEDLHYEGINITYLTNRPSGFDSSIPFDLDVMKMDAYNVQRLTVYGNVPRLFERRQYYSSSSTVWGNWEGYALNSKFVEFSFSGTADSTGRIVTNCPLDGYSPVGMKTDTRSGWIYTFYKDNTVSTTYWIVYISSPNGTGPSGDYSATFLAIKADLAT